MKIYVVSTRPGHTGFSVAGPFSSYEAAAAHRAKWKTDRSYRVITANSKREALARAR